MRKARILLILGIWIAVLPYLGFPYSWKDVLFTLSGLGLIWFSYMLYREHKKEEGQGETFDNFKENGAFGNNENKNDVATGESQEHIK
ncbi:hypothetical protein A2740_01550 [Candidatus Nomurabacteria bacterium RIFCSPHIGHO2_01_FULL_43_16]|nr:MAG: hypothetical protein A2740_01550 [Candidatus Nomurabacteria bacterium RIFCSPHIGHO2_01_FULL_43_16]OGI97402.1 MAG: hypothetical protein A3A11_02180 [Candidatus Nomurabacteria bacterium RIFCSPLOWO2_01_FULL_43_15]